MDEREDRVELEQATNSIHFLGIFLSRGKVISRSRLVIHPFTSVRIVSIRAARCSAHSYTGWIRVICAWTRIVYPMDIWTTHVPRLHVPLIEIFISNS